MSEIVMVRPHLNDIPRFDLPAPYTLRWYQPGDEQYWTSIHLEADRLNDITPELFRQQFGHDEAALAQRQAYLIDGDGTPVGTTSAWFNDPIAFPQFAGYGQVHWVAIHPEHQGKGLSRPLLGAVLERLRDLGHASAFLDTDTDRHAAVHLYERFGFARWPVDQP